MRKAELERRIIELDKEFPGLKFNPETTGHFWMYQSHYPAAYAEQLEDFTPKKVLEIGIGSGASLVLWSKLWPEAEIYGIDIHPPTCFLGERIHAMYGDQMDGPFLHNHIAPLGPFDLIIDDGSHFSKAMIISLNALWPAVAPGGKYLVEDMGTCYFWENNKQAIEFLGTHVLDDLNAICCGATPSLADLKAVQFYPAMCWLHKKHTSSSAG